jgi:hypothetical protein
LVAVTVFVSARRSSEAIMQQSTQRLDDAPADSGYEDDFAVWIDQQAALLRARRFDLLDVDNLIEEVESMGRSERYELKSRLYRLLIHLLKCQYQPDHKTGSWVGSVREQRARILRRLKDSPSLARRVQEFADDEYRQAAAKAADETHLPRSAFPPANPYTTEQLLDEDYFP